VVAAPLSTDHLSAWVALLAAVEAVDQEGENYDEEDLAEDFADPVVDPSRDMLGIWHGDALVAYAAVYCRPAADLDRVTLEVCVHPEWRDGDLGARVLAWACARGTQAHHEVNPGVPGVLSCRVIATNPHGRRVLEDAGFEPSRYFFGMERPLGGAHEMPDVELPAALRLASFDRLLDDAVRLAHNDAFRDHWGSQPRDAELWRTRFTGSRAFRPATSFLLLADGGAPAGAETRSTNGARTRTTNGIETGVRAGTNDAPPDVPEVAAYVLTYEYDADTAATGLRDCYIGQVGTRRAWRGRGAARALLARTLREAAAAGYDTASLSVDTANPTGALGLYQSLGFEATHEWISYERPID
jgi:ribosomal protein S18 acetylase RimI-like enzyme